MAVNDGVSNRKTNIISIRPKVLFGEIETQFPEENVEFQSIMPPTMIGSMTLLEGAILASLIKLRNANNVFEFGTFMGATSVLFAMNTQPNARIVTLDIDPDELEALNAHGEFQKHSEEVDGFLRDVRAKSGAPNILKAKPEYSKKITQIIQNSMTFDVQRNGYSGQFDLVFIDGGHDYATAKSDTDKAFELINLNGIVAWHDYGSPVFSDVTQLVDELSFTMPIFHVEASMIAFCWPEFTNG